MATVATSSNAFPLERPNLAHIDRDLSTGYLYAHIKGSTATHYDTYRSTDLGVSWSLFATVIRANVQEVSGIWVDDAGGVWWAVRTNESSEDRIYLYRLDIASATWSSNVLLANPGNGGVAGAYHSGIDLAVARGGAELYIGIAAGLNSATTTGIILYGAQGHADGTYTKFNAIFSGTRTKYDTGTGRVTPSVDIEHAGDAKSNSTPHLWVVYGRAHLWVLKCSWTGSGWSVGTAVNVATPSPALEQASGRWDGDELMTVYPSSSTVKMLQRNRANSTSTTYTTPAHTQGTVKNCAVNYDSSTGDARVFAVGTSTNDLYYVDFTRGSLTFGSWILFSSTDIESTRRDQYAIRRGSAGDSAHDVLSVADSTGVITHTAMLLAYNPTAPTWVTPATGAAADVAATLLLDWLFNDPNPGDTQGSYAVRRQIGAGAFNYWRASDSTWQVAEVQNTSGTTSLTLPSSWGADSDANHSYWVRTWDAGALIGPYGDAVVVVPSALVNPTITAPTAAQVIAVNQVTVTWTVAAQTAFRVRLVQTSGAGALNYDSGWITGADLSFIPPSILPTATGYTITLNTRNSEGLASADVTRAFSVVYLAPMVPTLVNTAVPASGWIQTAITNPAPTGGAPALSSQDLYRRVVGDTSNGVQLASGLASGASYNDWQAASGVSYEYRVQAFGTNGTSIFSAWTA